MTLFLAAGAACAGTAGEDVWAIATGSNMALDEQVAARAVDEYVSGNAGRTLSILNERDPAVRKLLLRAAFLVAREKVVSAQVVMFDAKRLPGFAASQTGLHLALVIDNLTTPPMDDRMFLEDDAKLQRAIALAAKLRPALHRCAALMIRGKSFLDEIAYEAGVRCVKERKATLDEKAQIMRGVRLVSIQK